MESPGNIRSLATLRSTLDSHPLTTKHFKIAAWTCTLPPLHRPLTLLTTNLTSHPSTNSRRLGSSQQWPNSQITLHIFTWPLSAVFLLLWLVSQFPSLVSLFPAAFEHYHSLWFLGCTLLYSNSTHSSQVTASAARVLTINCQESPDYNLRSTGLEY